MSNAVLTVSISGATEEDDGNAALFIVEQENARRAALEPPGVPLEVTPPTTLKASYEEVLSATITKAHLSYVEQHNQATIDAATVRDRWKASTNAQRQAALDQLAPDPTP